MPRPKSVQHRLGRVLPIAALAVMSVFVTVGCGGGDFGVDIAARPEPQAIVASDVKTIILPRDEGFSITLAPADKAPGLAGTAEASASSEREGRAAAEARVSNGGTASAGFQLGHSFRNDADRQIDLDVQVSADVTYAASSEPPDGVSHAMLELTLFAQNQRNLSLARMPLVRHGTQDGNAESGETRNIRITVTLAPSETASIYLAGQVRIDTHEEQTAAGTVKLDNLKFELTPKPAPAVRTSGNEPG